MRMLFSFLAASALALAASASHAAPVSGVISLSVTIEGLAPISLTSAGSVSVEGNTISIQANTATLGPTTVFVPVTASTAVNSLTATRISNLSGLFSPGGVTNQYPGEVCPGGGPSTGRACNVGGGLGGIMGLTGTVNVHLVPHVIVIGVNLNEIRVGQGGEGQGPFTTDAALFSTGTGLINTGDNIASTVGGATLTADGAAGVRLVTPTFVAALGNLLPISTALTVPVPEAGTLLLLGSGVAGLVLFGRRRD